MQLGASPSATELASLHISHMEGICRSDMQEIRDRSLQVKHKKILDVISWRHVRLLASQFLACLCWKQQMCLHLHVDSPCPRPGSLNSTGLEAP